MMNETNWLNRSHRKIDRYADWDNQMVFGVDQGAKKQPKAGCGEDPNCAPNKLGPGASVSIEWFQHKVDEDDFGSFGSYEQY